MDDCGNCNLPTCANCPYTDEHKTLAERFAENLKVSGDHAIEMLEYADVDCVVIELTEIYWRTDKDNIKKWAIKEIQKLLGE